MKIHFVCPISQTPVEAARRLLAGSSLPGLLGKRLQERDAMVPRGPLQGTGECCASVDTRVGGPGASVKEQGNYREWGQVMSPQHPGG